MHVLTLNTWGVPNHITSRTTIMVESVATMAPDVVCLQEVASPIAKHLLAQRLGTEYHIASSDYTTLEYPFMAYGPSIGVTLAVYFYSLWTSPLSLAWYVVFFAVIVCLLPQVLTVAIVKGMHYPKSPDREKRFDFMGNTVLVRKDTFEALEIIQATPFPLSLRGYPMDIWFMWWWFQTCFLRPNFMMVRCTDLAKPGATALIVVNVHLVVGRHNHARKRQILHVLAAIEAAKVQFDCQCVLLCGDFNAHHDESDIKALTRLGYHDVLDGIQESVLEYVCTWDPKNPNNGHGDRQRIDYIFHSEAFDVKHIGRCFDRFPYASDHYGVYSTLMGTSSCGKPGSTPPRRF